MRRTLTRRKVRILSFLPLCLIAWFVVAWGGARFLIVKADVSPADAIVVMSGSATYIERTAWAATLYRNERAPIVILTNEGLIAGWDQKEQRNPYYYELAMRQLESQGVPAEKIQVISRGASGTYEEALGVREFAAAHNLKRLLIVTSAYHSRRALWSLRRACDSSGIVVGVDPAPTGSQTPAPATWWLRAWGWKVVAGEYVKMIYYRMKY